MFELDPSQKRGFGLRGAGQRISLRVIESRLETYADRKIAHEKAALEAELRGKGESKLKRKIEQGFQNFFKKDQN